MQESKAARNSFQREERLMDGYAETVTVCFTRKMERTAVEMEEIQAAMTRHLPKLKFTIP